MPQPQKADDRAALVERLAVANIGRLEAQLAKRDPSAHALRLVGPQLLYFLAGTHPVLERLGGHPYLAEHEAGRRHEDDVNHPLVPAVKASSPDVALVSPYAWSYVQRNGVHISRPSELVGGLRSCKRTQRRFVRDRGASPAPSADPADDFS